MRMERRVAAVVMLLLLLLLLLLLWLNRLRWITGLSGESCSVTGDAAYAEPRLCFA